MKESVKTLDKKTENSKTIVSVPVYFCEKVKNPSKKSKKTLIYFKECNVLYVSHKKDKKQPKL